MVKLVSNLTSGVKNFVSSTVSLLREVPLSQVKSPNANGVKLSTPVVASGASRASGRTCAGVAGGAGDGCGGGAGGGGGGWGSGGCSSSRGGRRRAGA